MNILQKILGHKENTKDNPSNLPVVKHTFKKMKKEDLKSNSNVFDNCKPSMPASPVSTPTTNSVKTTGLTTEENNILGRLRESKSHYSKEKMMNELVNSQKYDSKGKLEGTNITKSKLKSATPKTDFDRTSLL